MLFLLGDAVLGGVAARVLDRLGLVLALVLDGGGLVLRLVLDRVGLVLGAVHDVGGFVLAGGGHIFRLVRGISLDRRGLVVRGALLVAGRERDDGGGDDHGGAGLHTLSPLLAPVGRAGEIAAAQ